ncbi:hypothetical protein L1887_32699 [Cichorium endivia]|nr:hypothetical protein L1887_32699 [Cichorium endivia]
MCSFGTPLVKNNSNEKSKITKFQIQKKILTRPEICYHLFPKLLGARRYANLHHRARVTIVMIPNAESWCYQLLCFLVTSHLAESWLVDSSYTYSNKRNDDVSHALMLVEGRRERERKFPGHSSNSFRLRWSDSISQSQNLILLHDSKLLFRGGEEMSTRSKVAHFKLISLAYQQWTLRLPMVFLLTEGILTTHSNIKVKSVQNDKVMEEGYFQSNEHTRHRPRRATRRGSTSASGGAVSAPAPIPSCTQPLVQSLNQPITNLVGNPASAVLTWGVPTRDGTPRPRQQVPVSQPQPLPQQPPIYKPQPPFQPVPQQPQPQPQLQPHQPRYQYHEGDPFYDEEDEGWILNHHVQQNQQWQQENVDSPVEIRPQLLGVLPEFRGHKQDDPYDHLYQFLAITNANIPRNTNRNNFRLRIFPFTLKDKAKYWFTSLQPNSIKTWEQLKAKLLKEFYPASKTSEIRRAIQDFQQKPGEAFHDAFERLKELLRSCPHHEFPRWQLVKFFFDGVDATNQAMINASSSGTIMMQDPDDAWSIAAAMGTDVDWRKEVKKEIGDLNRKFDRLMSTLQNGPQNIQQGNQQGQRPQEVNQVYGQGQGQYNNNNGRTSSNNNRGAASNPPETQQEMMAKMYELADASQQQSQAHAKKIANMERQIAQMAEDQRRRDNGKLPSNTKVNPNHTQRACKEHVYAVETVWRNVTMEDLVGKGSENKDEEGDHNEDKEVQKEEQSIVAGIKQKKKDKR